MDLSRVEVPTSVMIQRLKNQITELTMQILVYEEFLKGLDIEIPTKEEETPVPVARNGDGPEELYG